ncbi:hypothetical protein KHP62_14045 [Rhodobacteraceae bacterium NNCM2]|nr:hypothetical protein [Coraliihabitans acroporae]
MIVLIAFLAGAALGWYRAAKRGGALADRLQYALAHGIALALAALVLVIILARMN